MEATQEATMEATQEASEESKRILAVLKVEDELKPVKFRKNNKLLFNKRLVDHKDPYMRKVLWDKFCSESNVDKTVCKKWLQSQMTMSTSSHRLKELAQEEHLISTHPYCSPSFIQE